MTLDEVWAYVLKSKRSIYDKWWLRVDVPWDNDGNLRNYEQGQGKEQG